MERRCDSCDQPYQPKNAKSRFCSDTCRQRSHRAGEVVPLRDVEPPVTAATRATLEAAGRLATPAGAVALALAQKLDLGRDTGSAMASLAKQHLASLAEAVKGAPPELDLVDDLRARRERKISGG